MRRSETIFAIIVSVFSGMYLYFSLKIDFGGMAEPKAGFMPVMLGVMGVISGLMLTINTLKDSVKQKKVMTRQGILRFIGCFMSAIAFIPIFKTAGAIIGIFSIVLVMTKILGSQGWKQPVLLAVVSSTTAYVLFCVILDVPLPRGIF